MRRIFISYRRSDSADQAGNRRWARTTAAAAGGIILATVSGLIFYVESRRPVVGPGPNEARRDEPRKPEGPEASLDDHHSKVPPDKPVQAASIEIGPTKRKPDSPSSTAAPADALKWCSIETKSENGKKLKVGVIALSSLYGDVKALCAR